MLDLFRAEGVHALYHVYPGGHQWLVWIPRLNRMLDLASSDMAHPLSAGTPPQRLAPAATVAPAAPTVPAGGRLLTVHLFSPAFIAEPTT